MCAPPNEKRRPCRGGAGSISREANRPLPYTGCAAALQIPRIIATHWLRDEQPEGAAQ